MSHPSADPLNAVVREEIERLKAHDLSRLAAMPPSSERHIAIDAGTITVTVWHDVLPSGEHRVVAQASRPVLLGLGAKAYADGFAIASGERMRSLSDEELTSFT